MITRVEALNFRCLRYVYRPMNPFHVLVGPNASGKTTFLDVIGLLGDIVSGGLDYALSERTPNPQDLLFGRRGSRLELAVEATVPDTVRQPEAQQWNTVRYQVALGYNDTDRQFEFKAETLLLKKATESASSRRELFPTPPAPPESLLDSIEQGDNKVLVNKASDGNDNFYNESSPANRSLAPSFKLGTQRSALGNFPADQSLFPTATWFREYLGAGIQRFTLNSAAIRKPSPPTRAAGFLPDGSNVSWVAGRLRQNDPARHAAWIAHLRTALPDLEDIDAVERPEDRHCYMVYRYAGGLAVPSWIVSDGTLRLTGLTLPAYLPDLEGVFLVEEPENGIHPKAVATVFDSLSSVYGAQVLLATHSPVVLNAANTEDVLCFARDDAGATDIVSRTEHPHLQAWRGNADLGTCLRPGYWDDPATRIWNTRCAGYCRATSRCPFGRSHSISSYTPSIPA